ncbi:MAG: hypothetical protein AB8B56_03135 [Crocinitomicaceae bacterium]
MRVLFTAFLLIVSTLYCSSQVSESADSYPSSFVLGVSLHQVFSSNNEVRRYSLKPVDNGNYTDVFNKHRSSQMLRVTGEFQFVRAYVRGSLAMRTEHTNIEAHNIEEYYEVNAGQTNEAELYRILHVNEKTRSFLLSIEAGSYFHRRDRLFRIGIGGGFDFCHYQESESTGWNRVNKDQTVYYTTTFPPEEVIVDSKHLKESEEWKLMVRNVSMPLVVPKISFKASYRIYDNLSVSLQARMRLLVLQPEIGKAKTLLEFPVGVGFHYHFLN